MTVQDLILQRLGGYTLVLEWDVLGTRAYTNQYGEEFDFEYGDVIAVRIDAEPGETGIFTVKFGSRELSVTDGEEIRVDLTQFNIRWDKARAKRGTHSRLFWRCNYRA